MNQERSKDQTVEAWILLGDEHDNESQNMNAPHHGLPSIPNMVSEGIVDQLFI